MKPEPESALSRLLHEMAAAPGPPSMADRALASARRRRRWQAAMTGTAALAVIGALAVPFLFQQNLLRPGEVSAPPQAVGPPAANHSAGAPPTTGCPPAPQVKPNEKRVDPADWPQFVRIAIGALPPRTDYVLQYGYGVCDLEGSSAEGAPNAYAVINLGPRREHGHLTLYLDRPDSALDTCSAVRGYVKTTLKKTAEAARGRVVFCQDGTATTPLVFAIDYYEVLTVNARYPDGRVVWMESHAARPGREAELGADALRTVVTNPALVDLLPRS